MVPVFGVLADIYQNPQEAIPALAEQGVKILEGWYAPLRDSSVATLRRWRRWLEEAGMSIWSVHAPFGTGEDLASADAAERRQAVEHTADALERSAEVGASVVVVHAGSAVPKQVDPAQAEAWAREGLAQLAETAQRAGVRMAVENLLPHHPGDHPDQLLRLIDSMPPRWVGVCFDSGHAHVTGDILEVFSVLWERIITYHLHDNEGARDLHLPPGYGSIPWEKLAAQMRDTGFADPIVLECRPWQDGDWANLIRESTALLDRGRLRHRDEQGEAYLICARCGHLRFGSEAGWFCACTAGGGNKPADL